MHKKLFGTVSDKRIFDFLGKEKMTAYLGIDATASGMHFGHLLPVSLLIELLNKGTDIIILVGGFTASIGDPTDKMQTRVKQDEKSVLEHSKGILKDLKSIFKRYGKKVKFVNNKQWLSKMTISDILQVGYKISMNRQLSMETFSKRIKNSSPLTLSEFLYPELQMIDFLHLNKKYGCNIQVGGQDQWGNISFGVHYVKAITNNEDIFGICTPLITSGGQKIGKSEGAVFVRDTRKFYHYCMQMEDEVARFTEEILSLKHFEDPIDQKKEICKYAFNLMFERGEEIFDREMRSAEVFFKGSVENASENDFIKIREMKLSKIIKEIKACKTTSDCFNQIAQGAVFIDGKKVTEDTFIKIGKYKLSIGKKKHFFIEII